MERSRYGGREHGRGPHRHIGLGRALILTGCLALAWAIFPAAGRAAPEGDATIQTDSFTVSNGGFEDGQAFCPGGTRLVGGGLTSSPVGDGLMRVSGPLDETGLTSNLENGDVGHSWYAYVHNQGPGQNTFVSTAMCSAASDATIRVDFVTLTGTGLGDAQAFCPTGTRVVGGGVTTTGTTNEYPQVSGPLDDTGLASNLSDGDVGRSWYAHVYNGGGQNTFASTAICAPPPSTTANSVQTCHGKKATIAGRQGVYGRTLKGTSNADVIVGTSGKDKINAGAGNDLVCAGGGNDKVKGGAGKDKLFGEGGRDRLLGQGGKDLLSGGGGHDTCVGGPGKDTEKSC